MATNTTLHSSIPHHNTHTPLRHHSQDTPNCLTFLKPITTTHTSLSSSSSSSPSSSTTTRTNATAASSSSSSSSASTASAAAEAAAAAASTSLDALRGRLAARDFRGADEETRRLVIALAGEAAQRRGYVFFSEVQYIPAAELRAIDELWRSSSDGRFGYSVQKRIFVGKAGRDFTRFFIRVGWMKKLDTEVEQYNYRSFPAEFVWELGGDTPEGHLPLTNALRGTQLLSSIFSHPAFDDVEVAAAADEAPEPQGQGRAGSGGEKRPAVPSAGFKTDYSF